MDVRFSRRTDGQVDATLGDGWMVFNEALADAVSSLPPRGERGVGPSTYWIDLSEAQARRSATEGELAPFVSGNITYLRVQGDLVIAAYDFDPEESEAESMPLSVFLGILGQWRTEVLASRHGAGEVLPDTYRRNPRHSP